MNNNNYVIIGGSSGIGFALVNQLAGQGHSVWNFSRNKAPWQHPVNHVSFDVTNTETNLIELLPEQIDGLVYCPGSINLKSFRKVSETDLNTDFNINVVGALKCVQACYNKLRKSSNASVVLFSSVAVQQGMPFHSSIAAAKGAVEGLTRSLAAEFSPNIRVNAIAPSLTNTPLAENLLKDEKRREASAQRHPLKRIGKPKEIAETASWLLSNSASWVTGQIIHLDGGLSSLKV